MNDKTGTFSDAYEQEFQRKLAAVKAEKYRNCIISLEFERDRIQRRIDSLKADLAELEAKAMSPLTERMRR